MRKTLALAFMLLGFGVEAQTLVDSKLEQFARQELLEGIRIFGDDVNQAGIVIMEVNSGNVIANYCCPIKI